MKCEACHCNDATVQVKQVTDGQVREVYLCAVCAEKNGLKSPGVMADFLFGAAASMEPPLASTVETQKSCPACHLRGRDFQKTNRLGCAQCYETFAETLGPMIESMHRATRHQGKTPANETMRRSIEALRAKLSRAVNRQAFEEAATLRDEIKALEQ